MARFLLIATTLAACYSPHVGDCAYACNTADSECPDGLACDAVQHACRTAGSTGACGSPVDGPDPPPNLFTPSNYTREDLDGLPAMAISATGASESFDVDSVEPNRALLSNGLVLVHLSSLLVSQGSRLNVIGTHPVVFAIDQDADIEGLLFVTAGNRDCGLPAGNIGTGCGAGGGGGAGATNGGDGGSCPSGQGASGGAPPTISETLEPLFGGCEGGAGAVSGSDPGGVAGPGGGGIELSAGGKVTVGNVAVIDASGAGGRTPTEAGPCCLTGGGGGGGGGSILLEAPSIVGQGYVCAGGGGGAGAAYRTGPTSVELGKAGTSGCSARNNGGRGGNASPNLDGEGGNGAPQDVAVPPGPGAAGRGAVTDGSDSGGGGGGGGEGAIVIRSSGGGGLAGMIEFLPRPTTRDL